MIDRESNAHAGSIHLRIGITEDLVLHCGQIGYGVDPPFRGRRFAARSVRLVLPIAKTTGMDTVWITCDPGNLASRRTLELAGGEFVETREIPHWSRMVGEGRQSICRFRFDL
jgi:predicted acetyltransferase